MTGAFGIYLLSKKKGKRNETLNNSYEIYKKQ